MLFGALLIWTVAATQQILTEATTCGGELSNTHGQIKSPNYPEDYPADTVCKWVVSAPEGSIVELRFLDFDVEDWFGDCENDTVQIFDGNSSQSTVIHDALCGRNNPGSFVSTGHYMTIMLKSGEDSLGRKGFLADYSTRPAEAQPCVVNTCGGEITDTTPCKLQSPGYPRGYAANLNCSWLIRAPVDGGKVFFQFTDVNLNFVSSLCKHNNVTLYDGDRPDPLKIIYESVCDMEGNRLNKVKPFSSAGSTMLVVFRTSRTSSQKHGFSAQFNIETSATTLPSVASSRPSSSISTTSVSSRSLTTTLILSTINKATIAKTTGAPTAQADEDVTSNSSNNEKSASTFSVLPSASSPVDAQPPSIGHNAAALSGLVIGGIVFLVVVVFAILLIIAYVHWKRQNHRFNIRLGEEDARSDVNSLITDSRETVYKGKKYGKIVRIQDDTEAFNPL